ncbi:MAG: MarR family transcriptional regulator, partial [Gemmatales bacterium]|nr:MarR family transcriptional regulator [Gemmatales bacterium]MDW8176391.1 MarR family transcriptional regulator [Gemmatales bacterium]
MKHEPQGDIEAKIVAAFERLSQVFHQALWEVSWRNGLSATQAQVLVYLLYHGENKASVSELASRFGLGTATLSASISTLQSKGLVVRTRNEHDRRIVYARLTPRGRRKAQQVAQWTKAIQLEIAALDA